MNVLSRVSLADHSALAPSRPPEQRLARGQIFLLLALFALLVALRLPAAWAEGRFQDEEVSVFFAYAWQFPAGEAFWRPFGGYWNIIANGSTLLLAGVVKADLVSLARAPYVTMTAGLLFQLVPALLLLTGSAPWLRGRYVRPLAILLIAFLPGTEEIYLNVLHIQFHLAFACALILALDEPDGRWGRVSYGAILLLAPLCGPGAILLLPLFVVRAALERSAGRAWQAAMLTTAAAVQLLIFFTPSPVRGVAVDPLNLLAALTTRMLVFPTLGGGMADRVALAAEASMTASRAMVIAAASASLLLFGSLLLRLARQRDGSVWLLGAGLVIALASFGAGLATTNKAASFFVSAGYRYNYLPLGLLFLSVLAASMRASGRQKLALQALLGLMLTVGVIEYRRPMEALARGPSWPAEVAAWQEDPRHPLAVWPVPYKADLSGRRYKCEPPGAVWGNAEAPRYCESGWMYQSFGLPEQPR